MVDDQITYRIGVVHPYERDEVVGTHDGVSFHHTGNLGQLRRDLL